MKIDLEDIRGKLSAGVPLHMQYVEGRRVWWMEAGLEHIEIPDHVAMMLLTTGEVEEANDSLFGLRQNSQTYASVRSVQTQEARREAVHDAGRRGDVDFLAQLGGMESYSWHEARKETDPSHLNPYKSSDRRRS